MGNDWTGDFSAPAEPYSTGDAEVDNDDAADVFAWVFPVIHDIVRPVYRHLMPQDPTKAEQVSKLHGAAMMMLLADRAEADRRAIVAYLRDACEHVGLDPASFAALHKIVLAELTAVIRTRNRQSPRRRAAFEALILARLGALTVRTTAPPAYVRVAA
jgi:hypothetical protein